ncbi:hypothetical protein M9458_052466, partial [Cirrhinus mrigala]
RPPKLKVPNPRLPWKYQRSIGRSRLFSKQAATRLPPHRPWDCAIELLPGAQLPKGRIYPLSIPEYIMEALQQGFIQPTSPAALSLFFVGKKDGGLCPCIDYRQLNSQIIQRPYPLPLVPASLEELHGARVFSKLDLRSAYNLIRIQAGDEWKTAFITPTQIREQSLYLKLENCEFHQPSVQFLGYVISAGGVQMDQGKIQAIQQWLTPNTVKELQRFLGFSNFYRRFIQNYSMITSPLTSLLKARYWWPSMHCDITRYVQSCSICAMSNTPHLPAGKLVPLSIPQRPWSHIGVDFVTDLPNSEGNTCILVTVDRFSKSCELIPLKGLPTALETTKHAGTDVFRNFGLPEEIILDRGPQFISHVWKAFKLLGISVNLSCGYQPQTKGQTERKIQELGHYLCHRCFPGWGSPRMFQLLTTGSEQARECGIISNELSVAIRGLPTPEGGRAPNTNRGTKSGCPPAARPIQVPGIQYLAVCPTVHTLMIAPDLSSFLPPDYAWTFR